MEEQSTRSQETARTAQEVAARRSQSAAAVVPPSQPARETRKDATRLAGQLAGLGTETLTVWTDAAQHATHTTSWSCRPRRPRRARASSRNGGRRTWS